MRLLLCVLVALPSLSFAQQSSDLPAAIDRLNVVFKSARTTHRSLGADLLYGLVSGGTVYYGLTKWTRNPALAQQIFWYALAGSVGWGILDGAFESYMDHSIATRSRDAREYLSEEGVSDFFRLDANEQLDIARRNPDLQGFLLRMDEALRDARAGRAVTGRTEVL